MGFFALLNAYSMRVCLSIAITEMVVEVAKENSTDLNRDETCPLDDYNPIKNPSYDTTEKKYNWSSQLQVCEIHTYTEFSKPAVPFKHISHVHLPCLSSTGGLGPL